MLIYIRHGNDHSEDNKHRHDRHLSDVGRRKAFKLANRLIKEHGHPSIAYVSPFKRTAETLEVMTERFDRPVTVIREPRIAQFFSKKKRRDVSQAVANVISINEDEQGFHQRVQQHIDDVQLANHHRSDVVVWCVTHTIVLEYVSGYFKEPLSNPVRFLEYLVIGA